MGKILKRLKSIRRRLNYELWVRQIKASTPIGIKALETNQELQNVKKLMSKQGIPQHRDHYKNWDMTMIYSHIPKSFRRKKIKILDAGSGGVSSFLKLSMYHFQNAERFAIDFAHKNSAKLKKQGVDYSQQNISETNFENAKFDLVCSISVIEHGVDLGKFVKEMSRIIKCGGYLYLTTDFWCENISTADKYPYGKNNPPMKIFNAIDIKELIDMVKSYGFQIQGNEPSKIYCQEKVVLWERMEEEYTFLFLPFVKMVGN